MTSSDESPITLATVASELKSLREQVRILSLKLEDEKEKRIGLENKIKSLERR